MRSSKNNNATVERWKRSKKDIGNAVTDEEEIQRDSEDGEIVEQDISENFRIHNEINYQAGTSGVQNVQQPTLVVSDVERKIQEMDDCVKQQLIGEMVAKTVKQLMEEGRLVMDKENFHLRKRKV